MVSHKAVENLTSQQQAKIRSAEESDKALAGKYGVSAATIKKVRGTKPKAKKAAPKKAAKKAKPSGKVTKKVVAATDQRSPLQVLGGPQLPQPLR